MQYATNKCMANIGSDQPIKITENEVLIDNKCNSLEACDGLLEKHKKLTVRPHNSA